MRFLHSASPTHGMFWSRRVGAVVGLGVSGSSPGRPQQGAGCQRLAATDTTGQTRDGGTAPAGRAWQDATGDQLVDHTGVLVVCGRSRYRFVA